jgi:hypothetical protein
MLALLALLAAVPIRPAHDVASAQSEAPAGHRYLVTVSGMT